MAPRVQPRKCSILQAKKGWDSSCCISARLPLIWAFQTSSYLAPEQQGWLGLMISRVSSSQNDSVLHVEHLPSRSAGPFPGDNRVPVQPVRTSSPCSLPWGSRSWDGPVTSQLWICLGPRRAELSVLQVKVASAMDNSIHAFIFLFAAMANTSPETLQDFICLFL